MKSSNFISLSLFCILYVPCVYCKGGRMGDYSNEWLLEADVTPEEARDLAEQYGLQYSHEVFPGYYVLKLSGLSASRAVPYDLPKRQTPPTDAPKIKVLKQQKYLALEKRGKVGGRTIPKDISITDTAWPDMWYLHQDRFPSMKVYETWAMGYSGTGIKIAVLDDGLDITHPDLSENHLSVYSYDYLYDYSYPWHYYDDFHGTWCAGIISAVKNQRCIVGIAYDSKFSAIKIFDSRYSLIPSAQASALTHQLSKFDIYSNSWGPSDDGETFAALDEVVNAAFVKGVTEGRDGKGVVYTWAAGNGGENYDNCNCDGYASSIYTISITSISLDLGPASYSERCTSILAGTYGGDRQNPAISTTDVDGGCENEFHGTSATCPIAAGIIALALEANPALTWRDVQHLIVETSSHDGLAISTSTSGSGKKVNDYFGFGLLNAEAMVNLALTWKPVPDQIVCHSDIITVNGWSTSGSIMSSQNVSDSCGDTVRYLEHVQARVVIPWVKQGALEIFLTSPSGLVSRLLTSRSKDSSINTIDWTFMTVHHWGENPSGEWQLRVQTTQPGLVFTLSYWHLVLYGTATDPALGSSQETTEESKSDVAAIIGGIAGGVAFVIVVTAIVAIKMFFKPSGKVAHKGQIIRTDHNAGIGTAPYHTTYTPHI